ncbi:hypothetical protein ABZT43_03910 [Streptomyces sp. NPDC005349]|uniref:hypothetical protein n=1 Tax=Streptomyces sp. NPDC005349 TaxID=3157037 RepID=UPI0033A34937
MTTAHIPSRYCFLQGCDSKDCALENYRYMGALRLDHNRGLYRLRPAEPVVEHIQRLLANDWTLRQIAEASGVPASTCRTIINGQPKVQAERARLILNVPIGPAPAGPVSIDPVGSMRRLRALACLGHTLDAVSGHTGLGRHRLGRIAAGRIKTIDPHVVRLIADAYRQLSQTRGDCAITLRRAAEREWHGPLAWDDIDDPNCQPERAAPYQPVAENGRDSMRMAEIEHLYLLGESPESIAKQLDGNEKYVRDLIGAVVRRRAARAEQERAAARAQHAAEAHSEQLLATA